MIYPILVFGSEILRRQCVDVNPGTNVKQLVDDMFETMYNADGVGLAAPQIGKNIKILVIDFYDYVADEKKKKVAMINPIVTVDEKSNYVEDFEGCLSLPGLKKKVLRRDKISVKYFDPDWNEHEESYEGFAARIVQHEYDHIYGKLFIDYSETASISQQLKNIKNRRIQTGYQII